MFKMLNPAWWWLGAKAGWEFAKSSPVGFGFVWFASGVQTMWTTAFPASLAYPNWARELVTTVYPVVKEHAVAAWHVVTEILPNTS